MVLWPPNQCLIITTTRIVYNKGFLLGIVLLVGGPDFVSWISWGAAPGYINLAPLGLFDSWISWGAAPGYINLAPLGLFDS